MTFGLVGIDERVESLRNALGGDRNNLPPKLSAISRNLSAKHQLIVGSLALAHFSRIPVKTQISNMVLSASIRAAADLDFNFLDQGVRFGSEFLREHFGKSQRSSDAKVASGRAGAAGDIRNRARPWHSQIERLQILIEWLAQMNRNPRYDKILRNGDALSGHMILLQHARQTSKLRRRDGSRKQFDPGDRETGLPLRLKIVLKPFLVFRRASITGRRAGGNVDQRLLDGRRNGQNFRWRSRFRALFGHQAPQFVDSLGAQHKFQTGHVLVLTVP